MLTWEGKNIGRLKNIFALSISSVATTDGQFMLLTDESDAIFIVNGSECWRKSLSGNWNISNKGEYISVCINIENEGIINVYNTEGGFLYTYRFPQKYNGRPTAIFSPDNRYLLGAFGEEYVLLNNITGRVIWQKKCEGAILSFAKMVIISLQLIKKLKRYTFTIPLEFCKQL